MDKKGQKDKRGGFRAKDIKRMREEVVEVGKAKRIPKQL